MLLFAVLLLVVPPSLAGDGASRTVRAVQSPIRLHPENPHYFLFRG
jgi:hypothetical protein